MLAEKIETMLFRSTLNTRMRDFYDIWALSNLDYTIDREVLAEAIGATAENRGHQYAPKQALLTMSAIEQSDAMRDQWTNFQSRNEFAKLCHGTRRYGLPKRSVVNKTAVCMHQMAWLI